METINLVLPNIQKYTLRLLQHSQMNIKEYTNSNVSATSCKKFYRELL